MEQETGIHAIPFSNIPVKSPDASLMDFCVFGLFKRVLGNRHPRTIDGLWKAYKEKWELLDMAVLHKSLLQWKIRCRAIARRPLSLNILIRNTKEAAHMSRSETNGKTAVIQLPRYGWLE
ncbi:hypothetical protein L9F63_002162, partial [Diploptera punctata]